MSSTVFSVGVFAAFIVGSLGQIIGDMPPFYPVISFAFDCSAQNSLAVVQCSMTTNANPVFVLDFCGCNGIGCAGYVTTANVNDIMVLSTACKIELYEKDTLNGHNVISYTSLSGVDLTVNGYPFTGPIYTLPQVNTMVFDSYLCNNFHFNEYKFPALISKLDYTKCAPISHPKQIFVDSSQLQTYMDQANPLLLFLPKTTTTMTIADKAFLPLAFTLLNAPLGTTPSLISTGVYNTVTATIALVGQEVCTIRYSTTQDSTLSVYTFPEYCTYTVMPSGAIIGISASGSGPSETANLCNGDTGTCVSQCLSVSSCIAALVANDPLDALVEGLSGDVNSLLSLLPSFGNNADPITTLSNYISAAAAFNP